MIGNREITFNRFYVLEFLQNAGDRIQKNMTGEHAEIMVQLIENLTVQDDITAGIEKLAHEHGTGELSIFLFDIFDRIEDYPPTVAYDALQDIVEDFVNALGVMLEESETVDAIKAVNAVFAGAAVVPETEATEVPAAEEVVPAVTEDTGDTTEFAEQPPEPVEEAVKPAAPGSIPFEVFVEQEVHNLLKRLFNEMETNIDAAGLLKFNELVLTAEELPSEGNVPQTLLKLMQVRQTFFPWKYELATKASKIMASLTENVKKYAQLIEQLARENEALITSSLKNQRITLPEPKYVREEIPAEPTTIDGILSEYFKSEVEEHVDQIRNTLKELDAKPASKTLIKQLVEHFQSFNEISMIHGYSPIESFCSRMTSILNSGLKEKYIYNPAAAPEFERLFGLLHSVESLREVDADTEEARQLADLGEEMSDRLMVPRGKKKRKKVKKTGPETAEQPAGPESDQAGAAEKPRKETTDETGISLKDKSAILSVFRDLLEASVPVIEKDKSQEKTARIMDILGEDARLIDQPELQRSLEAFRRFTDEIVAGNYGDKEDPASFMLMHYREFVRAVSADEPLPEVKEILAGYQAGPDMIAPGDAKKLLPILGEIESANLKDFNERLTGIAAGKEDLRTIQRRHFSLLAENLRISGCASFAALPDFFIDLLENSERISGFEKSILQELAQSYKLFVDSLKNGGTGVDTGELVSVLQEMVAGPEGPETAAEEASESAAADEAAEPESVEEGEEDLNEIFRQESESSFEQIDKSLDLLAENPDDKDQYGIIERNLHSLKSSARLMGYAEVADIAGPLEDLCENLHEGYNTPTDESITLLKEGTELLKSLIQGNEIATDPFKSKLENLILPEPEQNVPAEKETSPDEKPLFSGGSDEDADLLEIFKEESAQYIQILESANKKLKQTAGDKKSLRDLETAAHSLKSAAKMLGFSEIGQLGDALEMAAESIHSGQVNDAPSVQEQIARSIEYIKHLAAGEKSEPAQMSEIISTLQPENLKKIAGEQQTAEAPDEEDRDTFLQEANDLLEKINGDLLKIEKKPEDPALLNNLYRNIHTLKGSAQIMQFNKIGTMAHQIEDFLAEVRNGMKVINSDTIDPVFRAVDEIQTMIKSISGDGLESSDAYEEVLKAIAEIPTIEQTEFKTPVIRQMVEKTGNHGENGQEQTIKLTTQRLDHLMNMAAGLIVNKTQLNNYLESMKTIVNRIDKDRNRLRSTRGAIDTLLELNEDRESNGAAGANIGNLNQASEDFNEVLSTLDGVSSEFYSITQHLEQNIREISQLTKQLHDDILQVRMVPSEFLFNRFPRAVRDLARKQKKKINLMVEGESTELDRAMIETLADPVMHLIRNAIDHGIETPKERKGKGKSEDGIILLKALRDKNQIIIEVQDDGKGIDPAEISEKAVKLGLADKKQISKMREEEILGLIFTPGFSTTDKATDVSGRGVGLDVVATQIQKLNGEIRLNSTPDKGTIFRIRVPLTLAITQAMLVELDEEILAIPISAIEEAIEISEQDITTEDGRPYLNFHNEKLPLKNLANFLNYEEKEKKPDKPSGLIIQDGNIKYVLQVDAVLRREEIVVKSLGPELREVPYISGGTVLGDGSVVLILDISAISHKMTIEYTGEGKDFSSLENARQVLADQDDSKAESSKKGVQKRKKSVKSKTIKQKKVSGRKPVALIVDDSLSVRKFVSAVLERNEYTTVLASDGPEALEKIKTTEFDIIITDLEMPKMQGLDLIEEIRRDDKNKDIPIIILTGKSGREHEEKGKEAGANAYIIKPFKEGDLVKTLEKFIIV